MSNTENLIAGSGQHFHLVPTVPWLVVEIMDGTHEGTSVWRREDSQGRTTYMFASHDAGTLQTAPRCLLISGMNVLEIPEDLPMGCDTDVDGALALVGVELEDDLEWLEEGASVLWDSASDGAGTGLVEVSS